MLRAMVSETKSKVAPITPEAKSESFMLSPKINLAINGAAKPRKATAPILTTVADTAKLVKASAINFNLRGAYPNKVN